MHWANVLGLLVLLGLFLHLIDQVRAIGKTAKRAAKSIETIEQDIRSIREGAAGGTAAE